MNIGRILLLTAFAFSEMFPVHVGGQWGSNWVSSNFITWANAHLWWTAYSHSWGANSRMWAWLGRVNYKQSQRMSKTAPWEKAKAEEPQIQWPSSAVQGWERKSVMRNLSEAAWTQPDTSQQWVEKAGLSGVAFFFLFFFFPGNWLLGAEIDFSRKKAQGLGPGQHIGSRLSLLHTASDI